MTKHTLRPRGPAAFTLIELLVVISIIALLSSLIIPAAGVAIRKMRLNRALAELHQVQTAIDRYKAQKGFYPPDNTNNFALPQLYYELTGTYMVHSNAAGQDAFVRINSIETIWSGDVPTVFFVGGFMNSSRVSSTTNLTEIHEAEAKNFWPGLESSKYAFYQTNGITVGVLGLPFDGPDDLTTTNNTAFNTWHYNSSNPTNNPDSYDLWLDLKISSPLPFSEQKYKTNRICNWSADPVVLH